MEEPKGLPKAYVELATAVIALIILILSIFQNYQKSSKDKQKAEVSIKTFSRKLHLVKPGETLLSIAFSYKMCFDEIRLLNPQVKNPNLIYAGSTLVVIDKTDSATL